MFLGLSASKDVIKQGVAVLVITMNEKNEWGAKLWNRKKRQDLKEETEMTKYQTQSQFNNQCRLVPYQLEQDITN